MNAYVSTAEMRLARLKELHESLARVTKLEDFTEKQFRHGMLFGRALELRACDVFTEDDFKAFNTALDKAFPYE